MQDRLERIERQLRLLRLYASFTSLVLIVGATAAFRLHVSDDQILRARGIVIVDGNGRERILIGAPIPDAKNRLRTNLTRVDSAWAGRYPRGVYMKYYPTYRNAVSGMLVLDEYGVDRVVVGDSLPDPNIGRRIGSDVGVLINDSHGFERSGYGLLTVKGRNRVVLGLDTDQGTEGLSLVVIDSGRVGMHVAGRDFFGFFGSAPAADSLGGVGEPFAGLLVHQGERVKKFTP
jgi:hypothetical protein